jgi:uncharacterized protein (UPF0210 family)
LVLKDFTKGIGKHGIINQLTEYAWKTPIKSVKQHLNDTAYRCTRTNQLCVSTRERPL